MHRTGLPAEKPIFQRRHFCPCPPCTTGDFHHCIYKQFLGKYQFYPTFLLYCFFLKCPCGQQLTAITNTHFVGEWHEENMHINYVEQNPKAVLRAEHAANIRLQLEETLGTFNGFFFVTLYLNAAVQRVSFGYVTRCSSFNDVCFRLHVLQPYSQTGQQPSNYFNFHTFIMPRTLCYVRNCQCPLQHSELIEYSKILTIAVASTNAGNKVSTGGLVNSLSDNNNAVFAFKQSYEDQELSRYKSMRVKLHEPYTIWEDHLFFLFLFFPPVCKIM